MIFQAVYMKPGIVRDTSRPQSGSEHDSQDGPTNIDILKLLRWAAVWYESLDCLRT